MTSVLGWTVADFSTQLTTKIAVGATTATLLSTIDDDGVQIATGRYFITIDGGNSNKEHFSCTLTGNNLTALKSISRQGVETSGAAREHRVGATVSMTDFAHLKYITDLVTGTTKLDGTKPLEYDSAPTLVRDHQVCTKKYIDDLALAGAGKASDTAYGLTKLSVAADDPTEPIAVGTNDTRLPSADEKAALDGTSGTPGAGNKYVTNNDTGETGTSKVVRTKSTGKIDTTIIDTGTTDGKVVVMTTGNKLPAVDGSNLTNVIVYANGVSTRVLSTASGDQTIAHGLGKTPKRVKISVGMIPETGNYLANHSWGVYDSSGTHCMYLGRNGNAQGFQGTSSAYIVSVWDHTTSGTTAQTATITVDGTNITLSWTKNGFPVSTAQILWEAEA